MIWVKDFVILEDYQMIITFDNDEKKIFDFKTLFNWGRFRELRELRMFSTARIAFGSIEWMNELDIDPETLYYEGKSI
jgi:hypothetical protein